MDCREDVKKEVCCFVTLTGDDNRRHLPQKVNPDRNFVDIRKASDPVKIFLAWAISQYGAGGDIYRQPPCEVKIHEDLAVIKPEEKPMWAKFNFKNNFISNNRYVAKFNLSAAEVKKIIEKIRTPIYRTFEGAKFLDASETKKQREEATNKLRQACLFINLEKPNSQKQWYVYEELYTKPVKKPKIACAIL